MQAMSNEIRLTARLVESLYVEAMVLADEVRSYFDETGRIEREALPPLERVAFSCESLKVSMARSAPPRRARPRAGSALPPIAIPTRSPCCRKRLAR